MEQVNLGLGESLTVITLNSTGKWFFLDQVATKIFNCSEKGLLLKIGSNQLVTGNQYEYKYAQRSLFANYPQEMLPEGDQLAIISLASLDCFIKNYSRRASLFTRFYGLLHSMQTTAIEKGPNAKLQSEKRKRTLTDRAKEQVAKLSNYKCVKCGLFCKDIYQIDHIIPFFEGGSDDHDNLQTLCPNCHSEKTNADRVNTELRKKEDFNHYVYPPYHYETIQEIDEQLQQNHNSTVQATPTPPPSQSTQSQRPTPLKQVICLDEDDEEVAAPKTPQEAIAPMPSPSQSSQPSFQLPVFPKSNFLNLEQTAEERHDSIEIEIELKPAEQFVTPSKKRQALTNIANNWLPTKKLKREETPPSLATPSQDSDSSQPREPPRFAQLEQFRFNRASLGKENVV